MLVSNVMGAAKAYARAAAQDSAETVKSLVNEKMEGMIGEAGLGSYLGEFATNKIKDKLTKGLEEFARSHPNAKPEELKAKSEEIFNRAQGDELCIKLANDDFMGYMKRRLAQIQAEMKNSL